VPYKDPVKRDAMAKVYKARWYAEEQAGDEGAHEGQQKASKRWSGMRSRPLRPAHTAGRHTPAGVIIDFHHVDRTDKQSVHHLGQELPVCGGDGGDQEVHPLVRQLPPDPALGGT
jgi:hypothetical protein